MGTLLSHKLQLTWGVAVVEVGGETGRGRGGCVVLKQQRLTELQALLGMPRNRTSEHLLNEALADGILLQQILSQNLPVALVRIAPRSRGERDKRSL